MYILEYMSICMGKVRLGHFSGFTPEAATGPAGGSTPEAATGPAACGGSNVGHHK
jgi:hypothetical protein